MKRALVVIGTRPEAIKLAPLVRALRGDARFEARVCFTGQHPDLVDLAMLPTEPDVRLDVERGTLDIVAAGVVTATAEVLRAERPDVLVVQGDTTSAFGAALAGFYAGVPVAHVEAGLRTGDLSSPWPEEGHRQALARLATWHFAPTAAARRNLIAEGVSDERVRVVGNTAVDALLQVRRAPPRRMGCRTIVVTVHRRESLGAPLRDVCTAVAAIARRWPDVRIVWAMHPHVAATCPVAELVGQTRSVELVAPLPYADFVRLVDASTLLLTDSGGLQEEAPYLGKPVVVLRDVTERPEIVDAGTAVLVGTDPDRILRACAGILDDPIELEAMSRVHHPYGDGHASERIVSALAALLGCDAPDQAAK